VWLGVVSHYPIYLSIMTYPCQSYVYYVRNIVMIITKYNTFATAILWKKYINNDTRILMGEMQQRYIRALVDPFCNH